MPHLIYNGKMSYVREDSAWFIWWDNVDTWYISAVLGVIGDTRWRRFDPDVDGLYDPGGLAIGEATVTEI